MKYNWELIIYSDWDSLNDYKPEFSKVFDSREALNEYFSAYILSSKFETKYFQITITSDKPS